MRQDWAVAVVLGVGAFGSQAAWADDGSHERAASAFVEARRLIEGGNCDAAVPKLRESLSYESSIGARLSIVDCIEARDAFAAWRLLKESAVIALMNHDDRLSVIEQRAAVLQTKLATISFKFPPAAEQPGFELRVDGEIIDRYIYRFGYATPAGRHLIEASSDGRRFTGSVNAEIGRQATVEIVLQGDDCRTVAPAAALAPVPAPVFDRGQSRRTLGLALGGLGVASIASGVVFGLLTLDKKTTLESQCGGSVGTCTASSHSLDAETEAAKTTAAISTVSFIVGGAALLGGVALYVTAPSASGPKTGIRVAPQAMRNGGGGMLEGSW